MKNRVLGYFSSVGRPREEAAQHRAAPRPVYLGEVRRTIEQTVVSHPIASLVAAACIGVCAGWLIKRR
jgi:hypothetical protein